MKKTYRLIHLETLNTVVTVNGKEKEIAFTGGAGAPFHKKGEFTTSDEKVQKAIEKRKDFGVQIELVPTKKQAEKTKEPETPEITSPPNDIDPSEETSPSNDNPSEITEPVDGMMDVYEDVKTVQQAKEVLVNKYGVLTSHCRNRADVSKFEKEFSVSFPNLD